MNIEINEQLTHKDEKLLCRYFDSEIGKFGRWRARRLIEKSPAAKNFVDGLEKIHGSLDFSKLPRLDDMWMRVASRIAEEDKGAVLLGKREVESAFSAGLQRLGWGMAGGVLTAGLLFAVVGVKTGETNFPAPMLISDKGSQVADIQLASDGIADIARSAPYSVMRGYPNAVDVDWVKSHGRIRVLKDPEAKSTVIWIRNPNLFAETRRPVARR